MSFDETIRGCEVNLYDWQIRRIKELGLERSSLLRELLNKFFEKDLTILNKKKQQLLGELEQIDKQQEHQKKELKKLNEEMLKDIASSVKHHLLKENVILNYSDYVEKAIQRYAEKEGISISESRSKIEGLVEEVKKEMVNGIKK